MQTPRLMKVIAAFVTGILVTLVATLLFPGTWGRSSADSLPQEAPVQRASAPLLRALPVTGHPAAAHAVASTKRESAKALSLTAIGAEQSSRAVASVRNVIAPLDSPAQVIPIAPATAEPTTDIAPAPTGTPAPLPAKREPRTVTLDVGTIVSIRLGETLSSQNSFANDAFRGVLASPVVVNGALIMAKDSKVLGRVVRAQSAGRVRGTAELSLVLTELNTTDGQRLSVETDEFRQTAESGARGDAAKVIGASAIGAIIGAVAGGGTGAGVGAGVGGAVGGGGVLLTRGKPVTLPAETLVTFHLSAPISITERLSF